MAVMSGGDKIGKALDDIVKRFGGDEVSVGFMEGAKYPDGTPVAAVAFWDEFGHAGRFPSPPRPFFRTMVSKEKPTWSGKMARLARTKGSQKVLALMGENIGDALVDSIDNGSFEKLSDTTLRLREVFGIDRMNQIDYTAVYMAAREVAEGAPIASGTAAKPLEWTSVMKHAITYRVNDGPIVPVIKD